LRIEERLDNFRKLVDKELDRYLFSKEKRLKTIYKAMRYSVLSGGKRIRPILAIEACIACGGTVKDAIPAGCAVEMVHAYSLIHDDLPSMDNDDYRRGLPTCHKAFGEANAILAGDALIPLAFNIISGYKDPSIASGLVKELSNAIGPEGMAGGQAMDLEYKKKKKNKETLKFINTLKTARLFEAAVKCGAIAANAGKKEREAMGNFGRSFGISYQIVDDILDNGEYVETLGMCKAQKDSSDSIKKARRSLGIFGKRADSLKMIAEFFLTRAA
jgi:geranylgeranyl diphosphate synthase type II